MVTAGANQGFTNAVLALLDAEDSVVLFAPYYFNHLMAVQVRRRAPLLPRLSSSSQQRQHEGQGA